MNILIKDVNLLTMKNNDEIVKTNILIEGSYIKEIGDIEEIYIEKVIDGSNMLAMPGLINAHTHSAMTLFRNYADDLPLWTWLSEKIWPAEEKLNEENVYWGSMLSILEMIKSGTTTFLDMYFFMDQVARAVEETGIRAVLSRGLSGSDEKDEVRFRETRELYEKWHNKGNGRIRTMVGPHSPYTCDPEYLIRVVEFAKERRLPINIHLSESKKEIEDAKKTWGMTPIEHVHRLGLFTVPTVAAHCVHLSEKDINILKRYNVSVVNNPGSNLKLGNGFAPVDRLIQKGVNVALGTDGASSNNNLNMFEEINLLGLVNKGVAMDPTVIDAKTALKVATINGAKALQWDNEIGSIEVGKKADIILIDMDKPHLYPQNNLCSSLVYSVQGSDVDTVIIDGKIIMQNRICVALDEEKIMYYGNKSGIEICSQK